MKTIKVIDLLNKIANDEEIPKYVKYYDKLRKTEDKMMCCYSNIIYKLDNNIIDLLDEVKILEDEKKIPEKLNLYENLQDILNSDDESIVLNAIYDCLACEKIKINEILDYLESKGE